MKNFRNKVVVITGAASGIGRALAVEFAKRGARVAISDMNETGLARTMAKLTGEGHFSELLDVADRKAFYKHADNVVREMGQVDIVINNAGVAVSETVENTSYEDFEWIVGINFWGVVYGTKAFLPHLKRSEEGWVVNISSLFGLIGVPSQSAYNATKFAVRGFTEALTHELAGSNTHALSVHPGGIRTNIAASARFGQDMQGNRDHDKANAAFERAARVTPEQAANTIIGAIERKDSRVLIGKDAKLLDAIQRATPMKYGKIMNKLMQLALKSK